MNLILDASALIALEQGERKMWVRLKAAQTDSHALLTHGGVVGQVWRTRSPKSANLARALRGMKVHALDESLGRSAGELLARAKTQDVIDAALVLLAADDDIIYTSDVRDIERLAEVAGRHVEIVRV